MDDPPTPPSPGPTQPVAVLNPEAGHFEVTADPVALAAADLANGRSLARFPYLEARYGERGRAFTRSDGAWLVTLASSPPARVLEQVLWLGTVLASRGMPRVILEWHLAALAEALQAASPSLAPLGQRLIEAKDLLAARRGPLASDLALAEAGRRFEEALGPVRGAGPAGLGELLAAAVADERDGISQAVPSLLAWAADPDRFPPRWIAAVEAAVAEARAGHVAPAPPPC